MKTFLCVVISVASLAHILGNLKALVLPDSKGIFSMQNRIIKDGGLLEEHGKYMLANMNTSVDPCEDFYEFACGNWANNVMVPEIYRNNTLMDAMQEKLGELVINFFKNKTGMEEDNAEGKAKRFFSSCMIMNGNLKQGYQTLYSSMEDPVRKENETHDWIYLNFYLEYDVTPLLSLDVVKSHETLLYEIALKPPYKELSNQNFTGLSEDFQFENVDEVRKEFDELIDFETKLIATASSTNSPKSKPIEIFIEKHNDSGIDWERFFKLAFNGTYQSKWMVLNKVENFTQLNEFLANSNKDLLIKYVKWRSILKFYKYWEGLSKKYYFEKVCFGVTFKYFSKTIIPWFIETTYDQDRRTDVLQLAKIMKDTFYSFLDEYSWLDNKTRSGAKSKLRAMDIFVGYIDEMRHRHKVDDIYKDVVIKKDFWKNLLNLEKSSFQAMKNLVGKVLIPIVEETYFVNGFYANNLNLATVSIGMNLLPIYHIKLPKSIKFGGVGAIIGHEICHGFDTDEYDWNYDGKKKSWWSENSRSNFKERYQCLESQYNKFIYKGIRMNGSLSSGENIADNSGARLAYHSYLRYLKSSKSEEKGENKPIPGLDFTNKQLFFLKFAQMWCDGRNESETMEQLSSAGVHTYEKYRVMGSLMNMEEFSEQFRCPLGSTINPLKKCVIW